MGGRFSSATPGFRTRRGPSQSSGPERSEDMGSVRILVPGNWSRTVAWPIYVTAISSSETEAGGGGKLGMSTCLGQDDAGAERRPNSIRKKSRKVLSVSIAGLKNLFPSK